MTETITVEELMNILSDYPPTMPIFFYDADKERDSNIEVVELSGPVSDVEDDGEIYWSTPYYCKGISHIEDHWKRHGFCPILCMREKTFMEIKNDNLLRKENA